MHKITIKTFFGLEAVLADELKSHGYTDVQILNRAVQLEGTWKDVYYLNLHLSCALSVLVEIARFKIKNEDDLYRNCMRIDWTSYFDLSKTFAIKGAVFSNFFKHSQFPFLKVKDAIADSFRKKYDERPNVSVKHPQVVFDLYINQDVVTLSLNTSGAPLFQRGYRSSTGDAPLNEVVAAAMIRMSDWDKKSRFVDPFCGSGTLLIEAAFYATGIPANIERVHYAFMNFKGYDSSLWESMREKIVTRIPSLPCEIIGSDINSEMITKTRRNLRALPFGRFIDTSIRSFEEWKELNDVMIVTNPPYGERLAANIEELYGDLGSWMKHELAGSTCWIISSSEDGFKEIGLRPDKKVRLYNGELECSFRKYSIYEGSKKSSKEGLE